MTGSAAVAIVVGVALLIAMFVLWARASHPEDLSSHEDEGGDTRSDRLYGGNQAPAGPDAESDGVAGPGEPVPGQPTGPDPTAPTG